MGNMGGWECRVGGLGSGSESPLSIPFCIVLSFWAMLDFTYSKQTNIACWTLVIVCFLQWCRLAILKILNVYSKSKQINYMLENGVQDFHWQKKWVIKYRKWEARMKHVLYCQIVIGNISMDVWLLLSINRGVRVCVCTRKYIHIISLLCPEGVENQRNHSSNEHIWCQHFGFQTPISTEKNKVPLEECWFQDCRWESTKWAETILLENKEILKKCRGHIHRTQEPAWRGKHCLNLGQFWHQSKE